MNNNKRTISRWLGLAAFVIGIVGVSLPAPADVLLSSRMSDGAQGSSGGACYGNQTCDPGLSCVGGACQRASGSTAGSRGGACYGNGTCDAGLQCLGGSCRSRGAKAGSDGGACYGNNTCDSGLKCRAGKCGPLTTQRGVAGGRCYGNKTCDPGLACAGGVCSIKKAGGKGERVRCSPLGHGNMPGLANQSFKRFDVAYWKHGWREGHRYGYTLAKRGTKQGPGSCKKSVTKIQIRQTRRMGRASNMVVTLNECMQGYHYYRHVCGQST